ncbi:MAG TPA: hypothetical protein VMA98_09390 [Candidatus Acidoferrales bacterium]|nr:hypothetical protein [Candidatus Acidoferrales bacterium]
MDNTVRAKIAGMRKLREWTVMPTSDDRIIVQTDGAIGIFDWRNGKGRLCTKGGYYPHLRMAAPYIFPLDFVRACLQACPSLGGTHALGDGAVIVENTVRID